MFWTRDKSLVPAGTGNLDHTDHSLVTELNVLPWLFQNRQYKILNTVLHETCDLK